MSPLSRFDQRTEGEPVTRLGRIAQAMLAALEAHPEYREGDKGVVMLDGGGEGMLAHGGYEEGDDAEVFVNLLGHVEVIAQANGMRMDFVPYTRPEGQG
jgi:hypothetical protein